MRYELQNALFKISGNGCSDCVRVSDTEFVSSATDYAIMSRVEFYSDGDVKSWFVNSIDGRIKDKKPEALDRTVIPHIRVDLEEIEQLGENKHFVSGGEHFIMFESLKFPQQKLSKADCEKLSLLKKTESYQLSARKRHYFGHVNAKGKMICNKCYMYNGQCFVYVQRDGTASDLHFSNGELLEDNPEGWFAVSPIEWKITNWEHLPKYINPQGDESELYLELEPKGAILGVIPFASKSKNSQYYQNSLVRSYLNNYNIHEQLKKGNGELILKSSRNYDLSDDDGIAFVDEVFDDYFTYQAIFFGQTQDIKSRAGKKITNLSSVTATQVQPQQKPAPQQPTVTQTPTKAKKVKKTAVKARVATKKAKVEGEKTEVANPEETKVSAVKTNPFGITVDKTQMKLKDQLKFYIDTGTSFMLHGPSGVGKTRRVQELDPDLVAITLRDGMLPEEITGKTIYRADGESFWDAPPWYKDICKKCEAEPDKNHVLFIDELSNVRAHEQSLVYHIVLNHSIDHNKGILPKNCVVVAAGNEKSDSEAAHTLAEPLFRRFSAHIYLKVDAISFLEWGSERQKDHKDRTKIHPLVLSYISTHGIKALHSSYDPEKPPQSTSELPLDPRAWEQVSDIIYNNGGMLRKELIENKVGPAHAEALMQFAENPPLTLEAVLAGQYTTSDIPKNFNDKYALALSLRRANESQIEEVRDFIGKYLGNEILAMYDSLWVENDEERALLIAELSGEFDETDIEDAEDEIDTE